MYKAALLCISFVAAHLPLTGFAVEFDAQRTRQPNIVFFLVDDLGWGAMGATGNTYHETPHFDALCAQGMRFTQAYAACTVCSPSRAAILTGRYPGRTNLTDWIPGHQRPQEKLRIPNWQRFVEHDQTTLAEALRDGGYRTGFFGKWHLVPIGDGPSDRRFAGLQDAHTPERHGYDVNFGGREWGQPRGQGKYFYPYDMPGLDSGQPNEYLTDRLTDEAIRYVEASSDQPFFLMMSYYSVHSPIMAKPKDIEYFARKPRDEKTTAIRRDDPAAYAAMHRSVDESVGRIVAKLSAIGELENTVIVFTGDNGGDYQTVSGGLRGYKAYAFEGGVRVPTCVVWPHVTQPKSVCHTPIIGTDFFPTLLTAAQLPALPEQHLDGKDLTPLLSQTGTLDRDTLYWHYPHYHRTTPYGAIRHRNWKLIEFFEDGRLMLFDLEKDPQEKNDLAKIRPEQARRLLTQLQTWRIEVSAQMPTRRP